MKQELFYPPKETILFVNEIVNLMSASKADRFKLLTEDRFLDEVLENVRKAKGDVYDKAAMLLQELIATHGFASGNKRTAFLTTTYFLARNSRRMRIRSFNKAEKVIRRIRQLDQYTIAH